MSISKSLFQSSVIYFIGQILSKIISFLLLPLYTNYINTSDFGYYDFTVSLLGVIVPVIFLEIWTGTLRFGVEKQDECGKSKVINNTMILGMGSLVLYSIIYVVFMSLFPFELPLWIYLYSFFWVIQLFLLSVARVYGKNVLYASSGVISVFFNAAVTILVVMLTNGSIISLYLGMIVSMIVQIIILNHSFHIFSKFRFSDFDKDLCKELIRFSLPLSFNSIMFWMLEGFNKYIIKIYLGLSSVGIYAVANRLSYILTLIISVFSLSWQETIFKISDKETKEAVYNQGFHMLFKVMGAGLVVLLPAIAIMFPYIIGNDYAQARNLIPWLLLSVYANAMVNLLSSCFAAEKNTKDAMIARTISCIINVVVLFSFIDCIGLYASPIALFLANSIGMIVLLMLIKKHVRITLLPSQVMVFITMFIISYFVYTNCSTFVNLGWLLFSAIIYCIYLKDFIISVLKLAKDMVFRKR